MCVVSESQQRVSGIILSLILAAGCSYQDCVLPVHPTHGKHVPFELDCPAGTQTAACQGEPGTTVPDGWFLFVVCDQGFVLDNGEQGNSQTTCADGRWLPSLPSCVYNFTGDHHRCAAPPYPQNGKYKPLPIECAMNNKDAEDYLLPGTFVPSSCVLLYSCNKGYELSDEDVISICVKGEWIPNTVTCNKGSTLVATRTNNVRDPSGKGCVLPKQPQNRRYCSFQCKDCTNQYNRCAYSPGSLVTDFVIKVQCHYGYGLANHQDYADIVCVNGTWNTEFPRCLKLCPPLESDSVYPRCMYGNTRVDCSKPMLPDTTAVYQCRPSYSEYPSLTAAGVYKRTLTCRQNGRWSNTLPECEPVCGVSKGGVTISPTVVDGIDTPLGAFPWHAGLYTKDGDNWQCICGGTLISNRIVLTAAHCVVLEEPKDLKVGLGKYYRSWDYEEPFAVKCNVSDIRIPIEYNGAATTYVWDIALILLTEKVQVNSFVMPVCRDIHMTLEITEDTTGYVVGWGKTKADGKESDVLLHNDLTIIDHTVCSRKIPKILSIDKFCGAKGSVSIAEKGDSGGGLTTISNDLHYIIGIVSVKIDNLSLFTNVSWPTHYSWLENEINSFDKEIYRGEK
ncbi:hypothetical protein J6590_055827 [Homalodisca vitripennis]|nr:hypothetical protein J6590_055827 [Homalodisca vitripennis]